MKKIGHWWKYATGEIYLLFQNAYQCTPEDLGAVLKLFTQLHGKPDLLILDYLDLLAPSKLMMRANKYERLGHASHYIRGLGNEYGCAILTAAQATRPRSAGGIENLTPAQMGDSYEKVRAADILLGLVQSDDEREVHQARLQFLKVREGDRGIDVPLFMYLDFMLLADLDHPNTRRIIREHELDVVREDDDAGG